VQKPVKEEAAAGVHRLFCTRREPNLIVTMGDAEVAPFRTDGAGGPIGVARAGDVLVGPEDFCNWKREAISGRIRDIVEAQFVAGVAALMPKIYLTAASDMLMKALKSSADMKYFFVNLRAGIRGFKSLIPRTGVPPQLEERELDCRSHDSIAFDSGEQYCVSTRKCVKTGRNARKILMVLFFLAGICISGMVETLRVLRSQGPIKQLKRTKKSPSSAWMNRRWRRKDVKLNSANREKKTIELLADGHTYEAFDCEFITMKNQWQCSHSPGTVKWLCKGKQGWQAGPGWDRWVEGYPEKDDPSGTYFFCATVYIDFSCEQDDEGWLCPGSMPRSEIDPKKVYKEGDVYVGDIPDGASAEIYACKRPDKHGNFGGGNWYEKCVHMKNAESKTSSLKIFFSRMFKI